MVRFDHLKLDKGKVTDKVLIRLLRGNLAASTLRQGIRPNTGQSSRRRLLDAGFSGVEDDVFNLITDILRHPNDGVRVRYKRMNLSVGKANRLKHDLMTLGWITQKIIPEGNTRKVVLTVTNEGRKVFGLPPEQNAADSILSQIDITSQTHKQSGWIDVGLIIDHISNNAATQNHLRRESLEHAYWKNRYALRLAELGYKVELESPQPRGVTDVVAHKAGQSLFFEIETGRSDFVKNLRGGLQSAGLVVIVATNEKAMQKIERTLAKEGLLIPNRVEIVLKDHSRFFGRGK